MPILDYGDFVKFVFPEKHYMVISRWIEFLSGIEGLLWVATRVESQIGIELDRNKFSLRDLQPSVRAHS
jgi:hypothetical protein